MLLVVDVGNSNTVLGIMPGPEKVIFAGRVRTIKNATADDIYDYFRKSFKENHISLKNVKKAIIASVVPEVTGEVKEAVKRILGREPMVLTSKLNCGMEICTDHPEKVGTDLLAASAAAVVKYKGPVAIFDLGTATTMSVISKDRKYLGTIIMPGAYISLNAMTRRASQLPRFNLEKPEHLIGKNTIESMQSGVMYGNASMMDGLVDRVEEELGEKLTVLVTGGIGGLIQPYCRHEMICERDLVLKGLWQIYNLNKKQEKS